MIMGNHCFQHVPRDFWAERAAATKGMLNMFKSRHNLYQTSEHASATVINFVKSQPSTLQGVQEDPAYFEGALFKWLR